MRFLFIDLWHCRQAIKIVIREPTINRKHFHWALVWLPDLQDFPQLSLNVTLNIFAVVIVYLSLFLPPSLSAASPFVCSMRSSIISTHASMKTKSRLEKRRRWKERKTRNRIQRKHMLNKNPIKSLAIVKTQGAHRHFVNGKTNRALVPLRRDPFLLPLSPFATPSLGQLSIT